MAVLAPAIPYLMAAGTVLSTVGKIQQGKAIEQQGEAAYAAGLEEQARSKQIAAQQVEAGKAEFAASQREAAEERRKGRIRSSRALALAAASGGGALDPDVVNIISGLESEGDLAARTALYGGLARERSMYRQAGTSVYEGDLSAREGAQAKAAYKTRAQSAYIGAGSTLLSGAGSALSAKYGKNKLSKTW